MPLREIINESLVSCSLDTPICDVADLMKDKDVGAVLITENDRPVGIVTDRDIVLRCVCDELELTTPVEQIMTKTVESVHIDDGIQDVVRCMKDKKIRRIPVVDDSEKAVGLISFGDIIGLLAKEMGELSFTTAVPSSSKITKTKSEKKAA